MLRIFVGIALLCCSFGGYLQFLLPLAGTVIIARELMEMRNLDTGFGVGFVSAAILAVYQVASVIIYRMPLYETGDFSSYLYTGRILLISLLLATLFVAFKRAYGRRVFGIIGLIAMNAGTAVVVLLGPVLNLGYDEVTIAMAVLVYAFVLGYISTDMRIMYLEDLDLQ